MQTTSQLTPFPRRLRYAGTERHVELESLVPANTSGRYCDLFRGKHRTLGTLALKRPRIVGSAYSDQQVHRFWQEAWTWKDLKHPNLLPFYGILEADGHIYLMSPWMDHGPLPSYLHTNPPDSEKLQFIKETAEAIAYLHSKGIVHGDIKGGNILVSADIRAILCDFGLTKMVDSVTTSSLQGAGSTPWMSPEVMKGDSKTVSSDVYAFGMTIYEIVTGRIPFDEYRTTQAILLAVIVEGKRPFRFAGGPFYSTVYEPLWHLATRCWEIRPLERPSMRTVAEEVTLGKSPGSQITPPVALQQTFGTAGISLEVTPTPATIVDPITDTLRERTGTTYPSSTRRHGVNLPQVFFHIPAPSHYRILAMVDDVRTFLASSTGPPTSNTPPPTAPFIGPIPSPKGESDVDVTIEYPTLARGISAGATNSPAPPIQNDSVNSKRTTSSVSPPTPHLKNFLHQIIPRIPLHCRKCLDVGGFGSMLNPHVEVWNRPRRALARLEETRVAGGLSGLVEHPGGLASIGNSGTPQIKAGALPEQLGNDGVHLTSL